MDSGLDLGSQAAASRARMKNPARLGNVAGFSRSEPEGTQRKQRPNVQVIAIPPRDVPSCQNPTGTRKTDP
jgi:hypothetical protein